MDVAVISKYGSVPGSGTLTRLFYVSKYLSKLGHSVEYIISDSNHLGKDLDSTFIREASQTSGVKVKSFKLVKYKSQKSYLRFASWIQFEFKLFFYLLFRRKELLIVSSPSIFSILTGVMLKYLHKNKLIIDIRDIWPMTLIEEGGISERHLLMRWMHFLQILGYEKADLVLSSIPNLGQHIFEEIGVEKSFHCLPMGYDADDDASLSEVEEELCIEVDSSKLIVGYVGSIGPTNNLDTFIEYVKQANGEKFHFLIVGDGSCYLDYKKQLERVNNVTFVGRVPKLRARAYIRKCDVMYFSTHESSIWKYGQSLNKLLDYMLMGKVVVAAYPEFGFKSMINEANCGYFIRPNCLKEHIDIFNDLSSKDKVTLKNVGEAGRGWVLKNREYRVLVNDLNEVIKNV